MIANIQSLINSVAEVGSENQLTVQQLQDWLSRFIASCVEEVSNFPEVKEKPFVDVIVADFDLSRPAFFVVAMLNGSTMTLAAGLADAHALRTFLEHEFPDDPSQIFTELDKRFKLSDKRLAVDRQVIGSLSE